MKAYLKEHQFMTSVTFFNPCGAARLMAFDTVSEARGLLIASQYSLVAGVKSQEGVYLAEEKWEGRKEHAPSCVLEDPWLN